MARAEQGYLILADISGYTSFLARTELDHAHEIISDLLEVITRNMRSLVSISKFEGDAVFAYVPMALVQRPETLLEMIEETYVAFRNRIQSSHRHTMCTCRACNSMASLDLKFFVHCGEYVKKKIGNVIDLVGNDVNMVHRLMKNSVAQRTGWRGYVLLTPRVFEKVGLDKSTGVELTEKYEHLGEITVQVLNLQDRWTELTQKRRYDLSDRLAHLTLQGTINTPASVVWEWLNDPAKRALTEQRNVQAVRKIGGRTKEGAVNHCAHGKGVVVEEILEWKPFEYIALRSSGGFGVVHQTYDLVEQDGKTHLVNRMRFIPKLFLLRSFAGLIMNFVARSVDMNGLFQRTKALAEKDWQERSSSLAGETNPPAMS